MNNKIFKKLFSIDTKNGSRVIIYILGIRIRFLKKDFRENSDSYKKLECAITDIPKATGTLRKVQLANLKLLEKFNLLCEKYDLTFWLEYGNLLGAVRHKGFIPWDDDIDIAMMREDYEKVISLFEQNGNYLYGFSLTYDNNGKNRCLVKIKYKNLDGIAIDIFPYDYFYKKTNSQEKDELTLKLKQIMYKKSYKFLLLLYKFSPKRIQKRFKKDNIKNILENNEPNITIKPSIYTGLDYPRPEKKLVLDYETVFPLKKISFEGIDFNAPNNASRVLECEYGDYMKLPNDCYPHHVMFGDNEFEKALDKFLENEEG